MAKPPLDRGYESPKTHQKRLEMRLGSMQVKAPLNGLEEGYSTHAQWTLNMAKPPLDRGHTGHQTRQK